MLVTNFVYEKEGARRKKVMKYHTAFPKDKVFGWNDVKFFMTGQYILMHSVIYEKADPYTLKAFTYNYLGATKSHGCIRLTTADSRWIYEHCALGTSVTVYESPVPGPFDRPVIKTMIPDTQTYDPTDANVPENGLQ